MAPRISVAPPGLAWQYGSFTFSTQGCRPGLLTDAPPGRIRKRHPGTQLERKEKATLLHGAKDTNETPPRSRRDSSVARRESQDGDRDAPDHIVGGLGPLLGSLAIRKVLPVPGVALTASGGRVCRLTQPRPSRCSAAVMQPSGAGAGVAEGRNSGHLAVPRLLCSHRVPAPGSRRLVPGLMPSAPNGRPLRGLDRPPRPASLTRTRSSPTPAETST
jgi:hypothetical protein